MKRLLLIGEVALWAALAFAIVFGAWKLYRYILRVTSTKKASETEEEPELVGSRFTGLASQSNRTWGGRSEDAPAPEPAPASMTRTRAASMTRTRA